MKVELQFSTHHMQYSGLFKKLTKEPSLWGITYHCREAKSGLQFPDLHKPKAHGGFVGSATGLSARTSHEIDGLANG